MKPKIIEQSRLTITEDTGEKKLMKDAEGEIKEIKILKKYIAKQEVNLGSLKKPNKKIVELKYDVWYPQIDPFRIFKK